MAVDIERVSQEFEVPDMREIQRLEERIAESKADIRHLWGELRSLREEFRVALDVQRRLAILEAKIGH